MILWKSGLHILKVIIPVSLCRADQSKRCKLAASCRIQLWHTLTVHNKYKIQIHNSRIQLCHTLEAQGCQCTSISACVSFFYFSICEACILSWIEFRFVGHNIILGCLQCAEPICVLLCILDVQTAFWSNFGTYFIRYFNTYFKKYFNM